MNLTPHQVEAIVQWDVGTWSRALFSWEKSLISHGPRRALELGGRSGGLSLWLALNGIATVCSDLENVEALARPLHEKHGISHLIEYRDIDAANIGLEEEFDIIAFKSIIGGIGRHGDREKAQMVFDEIHRALKPGGILFFAENLSASPLHAFVRKRFVKWGKAWTYWKSSDLQEFMSDFSKVELRTTGFSAAFGRSEGQRRFLAKLDRYIFDDILPTSYHYVAYGFAIK
jgi:SAM-dependent methyltransferase